MQVIFMDESGYSFNWKVDLKKQPYYVLSAVCLPSEQLSLAYKEIRNSISNLNFKSAKPLGQGFEIKARDISKGSGYWRIHNDERNTVRDIMLTTPKKYGGTAFIVVIDKVAHEKHYAYPGDPYSLSLGFIFERLQMYLSDIRDYGICIYDQNKRLEDNLQNAVINLLEGSELIYCSPLNRIIEFSLGRSENSIGLQVADFFATMTNTHVKKDKSSPCGWWDELVSSLHRKDGHLQGIGYKKFPERKINDLSNTI